MINAMLHLRFVDPAIARRLQNAKTNKQREIAWCYFAAVLTEEVRTPVTDKQLRSSTRT